MGGLRMYYGRQAGGYFHVSVIENGKNLGELDQRRDLRDFGSFNMSWGGIDDRGGNQLALAMLADMMDDQKAIRLSEKFRRRHIDFVPTNEPFRLCQTTVAAIAQSIEAEISVNTPWRKAS